MVEFENKKVKVAAGCLCVVFIVAIMAAILFRHGKPQKVDDIFKVTKEPWRDYISIKGWDGKSYDGKTIAWDPGYVTDFDADDYEEPDKGKVVLWYNLKSSLYHVNGENVVYAVRFDDYSGKCNQEELKEKYIRYVCTLPVNVFLEDYEIYLLTEEQIRNLRPMRDEALVISLVYEGFFRFE